MHNDEEVTAENEDDVVESLDWDKLFGDDDESSEKADADAESKDAPAEAPPKPRPEVEDDAAMYVRLRAKYPTLFESKDGEDFTEQDKVIGDRIAQMSESEFRQLIVSETRAALREEAEIKRQLRAAVLEGVNLSQQTREEFEREIERLDPSQAYAMLNNPDSIQWTRDSLVGREIRGRGLKVPRREPTQANARPASDLDTSDPVIAAGMRMFGLTPQEVEAGKAAPPPKRKDKDQTR